MARLLEPVSEKDHIQGPFDAPLTLVEYGDYQCPFCGKAYYVLKAIQEEMGKNLRFVFRNFPLKEAHPYALAAAETAEACALQKKFWEAHDLIFEHQEVLSPEMLVQTAEQLGLDLVKFKHDVVSNKVIGKIENDFMKGVMSGVNGTPCFFINGERYNGLPTFEALMQALTVNLIQ